MTAFQSPDGMVSVELVHLACVPSPTRAGDPVGDGWYLIVRVGGSLWDHVPCDQDGATSPVNTARLVAAVDGAPLVPVPARKVIREPWRVTVTYTRRRDRDRWTIINPEALTRAA